MSQVNAKSQELLPVSHVDIRTQAILQRFPRPLELDWQQDSWDSWDAAGRYVRSQCCKQWLSALQSILDCLHIPVGNQE